MNTVFALHLRRLNSVNLGLRFTIHCFAKSFGVHRANGKKLLTIDYVNHDILRAVNGLTLSAMEWDCNADFSADVEENVEDLPSSLIIANLPAGLCSNETSKNKFESMFKAIDESVTFSYYMTFKRCRVQFSSSKMATAARLQLDYVKFNGNTLRCFFSQVSSPKHSDDQHLKLPELEKQFLISPPASPPVGWEQAKEAQPGFGFELLSRLAGLSAEDRELELIPASAKYPSIKVHPCPDDDDNPDVSVIKPKILHTSRPAL